MTDPAPDPAELEPLAIAERSAATTRAAHALRRAAGLKYLVFRGAVDDPVEGMLFQVHWDGGEWLLTADEALLMAAIAARSMHGWAGYQKVSYRRGMLRPEAQDDTPPGRPIDR
jgi:hypothetical protein